MQWREMSITKTKHACYYRYSGALIFWKGCYQDAQLLFPRCHSINSCTVGLTRVRDRNFSFCALHRASFLSEAQRVCQSSRLSGHPEITLNVASVSVNKRRPAPAHLTDSHNRKKNLISVDETGETQNKHTQTLTELGHLLWKGSFWMKRRDATELTWGSMKHNKCVCALFG